MADRVDHLYFFMLGLTAFFTLLIFVLIVYFALKYRRRSENDPLPATTAHNIPLEITWTVIPSIIVFCVFVWGARIYVDQFNPPDDAMEIFVVGKQWMWKIQHPQGKREINELHVPVGRAIRLTLSSEDVIHDFFIPDFRMKHDVLPRRYTSEWFQANQIGSFHIFCSQYCGTDHARMIGTVTVMDPAKYQQWLTGATPDESPVESGRKLFAQFACNTCHGQRAPTLAGLYGTPVKLADGRVVVADENYLRDSILNAPQTLVAVYPTIMPSYRGQLSEDQLNHLIAYIKSLKTIPNSTSVKP